MHTNQRAWVPWSLAHSSSVGCVRSAAAHTSANPAASTFFYLLTRPQINPEFPHRYRKQLASCQLLITGWFPDFVGSPPSPSSSIFFSEINCSGATTTTDTRKKWGFLQTRARAKLPPCSLLYRGVSMLLVTSSNWLAEKNVTTVAVATATEPLS